MLPITSYLGIGSNLGDRLVNIENSIRYLDSTKTIRVKRISHIYETLPHGGSKNQPKYLNSAVEIRTSLSPLELLDQIKIIEKRLKRKTSARWSSRTIDLDILFYEDLIFISDRLYIPHPLLHKRSFVLEPLSEIAADFIHPLFGKNIKTFLRQKGRHYEEAVSSFN